MLICIRVNMGSLRPSFLVFQFFVLMFFLQAKGKCYKRNTKQVLEKRKRKQISCLVAIFYSSFLFRFILLKIQSAVYQKKPLFQYMNLVCEKYSLLRVPNVRTFTLNIFSGTTIRVHVHAFLGLQCTMAMAYVIEPLESK